MGNLLWLCVQMGRLVFNFLSFDRVLKMIIPSCPHLTLIAKSIICNVTTEKWNICKKNWEWEKKENWERQWKRHYNVWNKHVKEQRTKNITKACLLWGCPGAKMWSAGDLLSNRDLTEDKSVWPKVNLQWKAPVNPVTPRFTLTSLLQPHRPHLLVQQFYFKYFFWNTRGWIMWVFL